jgi:hypothetical protein
MMRTSAIAERRAALSGHRWRLVVRSRPTITLDADGMHGDRLALGAFYLVSGLRDTAAWLGEAGWCDHMQDAWVYPSRAEAAGAARMRWKREPWTVITVWACELDAEV